MYESPSTSLGRHVLYSARGRARPTNSYLERTKGMMPISAALLKYGFESFSLHILEIVVDTTSANLLQREDYWFNLIRCSYNVADILTPFASGNHPRTGTTVSQEVRDKISNTLKGRVMTEAVKSAEHVLARSIVRVARDSSRATRTESCCRCS